MTKENIGATIFILALIGGGILRGLRGSIS